MFSPVPRPAEADRQLGQTGRELGGGTGRAGESMGREEHLQELWLAWPGLIIIAIHKHERAKYSHPTTAIWKVSDLIITIPVV